MRNIFTVHLRFSVFISFISAFFFLQMGAAQSNKWERRWQEAIDALEKTDLIKEYRANKELIEMQVEEFIYESGSLHPDEVKAVQQSYEEAIALYDNILEKLKEDFTDPATRRYLAEKPERLTEFLARELDFANRFYTNNVQYKIDRLINRDGGAIGLMEVGLLISLTKEVLSIIQNQQEKLKKLSESYFESHFVSNLKLKRWEEYQ